MLGALLLTGALAIGDAAPGGFACNDPAFQLDADGTLKASLVTPQLGFTYRFTQYAATGNEKTVVITAGQPLTKSLGGRALPEMGRLEINEHVNLGGGVNVVRISLEGLSMPPRAIICAAATPPPA